MYVLITQLLSGLALFLFGMKYMSDSLQQAAGGRLRTILDRCTRNKYIANRNNFGEYWIELYNKKQKRRAFRNLMLKENTPFHKS